MLRNLTRYYFSPALRLQRKTLGILHFNDVYNIEEHVKPIQGKDILAGAPRFVTAFKEH